MRLLVLTFCFVLLNISLVSCFSDNADFLRVKRSNVTADDEGFSFKKLKDGAKAIGSKVSSVAAKGYEEIKNLFSSDRKVGDYNLNKIDVRVRDEEDYEEVGVKRPKRDVKKEDTSKNVAHELDEIVKDINVLNTSESKLKLEMDLWA